MVSWKLVNFSLFLSLLIFSAAVASSYQSSVFEGAFLKYEISLFGQPITHSLSLKRYKELYESLEVPVGKMLFLLQNATGGVQPVTSDMWEVSSSPCGVLCSSDRAYIQIIVESADSSAYVVNYTVIFSNFTAIGIGKFCEAFAELLGPPTKIKDGYLVWLMDSLALSKRIIVDASSWNAVDADSGRPVGEWLFWLSPFDLSANYTLILAGINWAVPAGLTLNLSGFVGYLLYLNASNMAPEDYVVGGAKIERARTLAAYSYPLLYSYEKVLKGGRVSEEFVSWLRRYGCSVVQHPNSTIEVLCETFLKAAARVEQRKAWKVVPIPMWIDPNHYRTFAAIRYGDLYLATFPLDSYVFVYDRQTGLLLEASHDPSFKSWGYAPLPSAYLSFGNSTLAFTILNGLVKAKLVETNIPLQTPSLGSAGRVEADFAYALLVAIAALALLASIAKRWR